MFHLKALFSSILRFNGDNRLWANFALFPYPPVLLNFIYVTLKTILCASIFFSFLSYSLSLHLSVSFLSCPLSQSIDPGQQFTWENSNMEVNKPKNRYANVIAYDHSRVVLTSVDGKSSCDHLTL